MSTLKKILVIGTISVSAAATQASFAAQKPDRSYDQEVVALTEHVQKAQDAGRITPRQAVDFKNKEKKIVAKVITCATTTAVKSESKSQSKCAANYFPSTNN
jgi:hypothetical protein